MTGRPDSRPCREIRGHRRIAPGKAARRSAAIAGGLISVAACSRIPDNLPKAPLVPYGAPGVVAPLPDYRLQLGDVIVIRMLLAPEFNEEVAVRPDGRISTAIVQDVFAFGRTPAELAAELRALYRNDLPNPRLTVTVKSVAPTRIYVAGEVNNPGEFATVGPALTITQAIARAGGVKLSSDISKVFIIRRDRDGKPQFLATRYDDATHARDDSADVQLAPYDLVYVPNSGVSEVYKLYNQYVQQFINPSLGITYLFQQSSPSTTTISTIK